MSARTRERGQRAARKGKLAETHNDDDEDHRENSDVESIGYARSENMLVACSLGGKDCSLEVGPRGDPTVHDQRDPVFRACGSVTEREIVTGGNDLPDQSSPVVSSSHRLVEQESVAAVRDVADQHGARHQGQ